MKEEIWRPIKGYEGLYEVSSYGNVRSVDRIVICSDGRNGLWKGRMMKPKKDIGGYLICSLWKNSKGKSFRVHRLVAQAFIQNPDNLPQVNHKDENKYNNHVENLEWCDGKYNVNYGTCIQRRAEKYSKPVLQLDKETNKVIAQYLSAIDAKRKLNIHQDSISKCCRGINKTAGGYKWKYA